MHGTHIPIRKWFIAAFLVATHSNGISALQLQAKLGLGSYKSAWLLLHKLRRAMVNPDREKLSGTVEIDETFIPYRKSSDPVAYGRGKRSAGLLSVVGAVEAKSGGKFGRIRLKMIGRNTREELKQFVLENTVPGANVVTDGNPAYDDLDGRNHFVKNLSAKNALPAHIQLPGIHRVFSNMKRFGMGVYHGFREKHLDAYLNEIEFRWNRRRHFQTNLDTLLGLGVRHRPVTYREIVGDTSEWKKLHRDDIYRAVDPERLKSAKIIAKVEGRDALDVLAEHPREKRTYERKSSSRPILSMRPEEQRRVTRRHQHPPKPWWADNSKIRKAFVDDKRVVSHAADGVTSAAS